jgi:hypothetical protein
MAMKTISFATLVLFCGLAVAAPSPRPRFSDQMTPAEVADLIDEATGHQFARGEVRDFRVVDLDGDGNAELVAWDDISGRGHGRIFALSATPKGLRASSIVAFRIDSLNSVLLDLHHDGKIEAVVPRMMTPYAGGYPPAQYPAVYVLASEGLVDRSASFADYYVATELPRLEREIADLDELQGESDVALRDAKVAERDKLLRLTGREASAGLAVSEQWAGDALPRRRILAASVLRDIGGEHARSILEKLAHDTDRDVAQSAKRDRE